MRSIRVQESMLCVEAAAVKRTYNYASLYSTMIRASTPSRFLLLLDEFARPPATLACRASENDLLMKTEKAALSYVLIFSSVLLLSPICLAQNVVTANTVSPNAAIGADIDSGGVSAGEQERSPGAPTSADPQRGTTAEPNPNRLKVVIYLIEAWAPIFGASFKIPNTPSTSGGGSGSTTGMSL